MKDLGTGLNGIRRATAGYQERQLPYTLMANLLRRLKKLEARMTNDKGLVPGSQKWMDYWLEQFDKLVSRGDEAKHIGIPLAVIDAIVNAAELESVDQRRQCRLTADPFGFTMLRWLTLAGSRRFGKIVTEACG